MQGVIKNIKKHKAAKLITEVVDEGSDKVTTLSEDPEAKYISIGQKDPGEKEKIDR